MNAEQTRLFINMLVSVYRRSTERWREEGHAEADIRAFIEADMENHLEESCAGLSPLAAEIRRKKFRKPHERVLAILYPKVPK